MGPYTGCILLDTFDATGTMKRVTIKHSPFYVRDNASILLYSNSHIIRSYSDIDTPSKAPHPGGKRWLAGLRQSNALKIHSTTSQYLLLLRTPRADTDSLSWKLRNSQLHNNHRRRHDIQNTYRTIRQEHRTFLSYITILHTHTTIP